MPTCPTCGSSHVHCLECGWVGDSEDQIATWIDGASTVSVTPTVSPDLACGACGYSGEMVTDDRTTSCPACGVVRPVQRSNLTLRVTQLIDCPECGRQIGITLEDRGKTLVCPECSYFLGTPESKATE